SVRTSDCRRVGEGACVKFPKWMTSDLGPEAGVPGAWCGCRLNRGCCVGIETAGVVRFRSGETG
ncbi:MAG: hypothetical protein ACKOJF_09630, partial [Planctomycetaceae bacterium]